MVGNDVEHQVVGPNRLEAVVAEGARELLGESRMLVHHHGQAGLACGCGLNDHRQAPPNSSAELDASSCGASLCIVSAPPFADMRAGRYARTRPKVEPHPTSSCTARAACSIASCA